MLIGALNTRNFNILQIFCKFSRVIARFPVSGILRAERNFSLSFLISSTREITRQREIPHGAENSA
jgi:hypothetical protein